jgi:hypothetical protein
VKQRISQGLRDLFQIPATSFFVAAEEHGKVSCFFIPAKPSDLQYGQFFDKKGFAKAVNHSKLGMLQFR